MNEEEEQQSQQRDEETPPDADGARGGTNQELAPPPPPAEPQPLDFDALINHLSRLPAETERAWSGKALEPDLLGQSEEVLRAQWGSLLAVLDREANDSTGRMRARGIDPATAAHPEGPRGAAALEPRRRASRSVAGPLGGSDAGSNRSREAP